jgi:hypothetical protein
VENPVSDPPESTVDVNRIPLTTRLAPHAILGIEAPVRGGGKSLAIRCSGDRCLVILTTEFR